MTILKTYQSAFSQSFFDYVTRCFLKKASSEIGCFNKIWTLDFDDRQLLCLQRSNDIPKTLQFKDRYIIVSFRFLKINYEYFLAFLKKPLKTKMENTFARYGPNFRMIRATAC